MAADSFPAVETGVVDPSLGVPSPSIPGAVPLIEFIAQSLDCSLLSLSDPSKLPNSSPDIPTPPVPFNAHVKTPACWCSLPGVNGQKGRELE